MKNINTSIFALAISIVIAGFFVGNILYKSNKNNRDVTVKGLATRQVDADIAVWPMEISLSGNDLNLLYTDIQNQKEAVKSFFLDLGFNSTQVNVGATNVIDKRLNLYDSEQKGDRYLLSAELTVRTGDIPLIQKAQTELIDLIGEGILVTSKNQWAPIEYSFTALNDIKPEMIEESTVNAKEAASKFAENASAQLGSIKSATQGLFTISDLDANTPDKKVVRVVSTVSFYLKD